MTHPSRKATPTFALLCLTVATLLVMPLFGQDSEAVGIPQDWSHQITGLPHDWTHHYLVFSNPGTEEEAIQNGAYDRWFTIVNDPRYIMQQVKRGLPAQGPAAADVAKIEDAARSGEPARSEGISTEEATPILSLWPVTPRLRNSRLHRDWSMDMATGAKVGAGQYPAKFSFSTTNAYCDSNTTPDFVVFNTDVAGSATQASIVAYDNLYSGCSGSHPLVYWQYNTGGTIPTSVVLSLDGSQVAFMQTGAPASLVLLKWAKSATLTTLASTTAANYRSCVTPCMTVIPFSTGTASSTNSSPFYDYSNDVLYVGDNSGVLHKFENIFNSGTPAEITGGGTTSGWPQTIATGRVLTSPVLDFVSGNVFVGSGTGTAGRRLHKIPAGGGSSNLVTSGILGETGSRVVDAPLVDSAAGRVYVFINADTAATTSSGVYQFPVSFAAGSTGTEAQVGAGATARYLYHGTFDNAYFTSTSGSSPTGSLYVCGHTAGTPILYQVSINSNSLGTVHTGPTLTSATTTCSPVTEFFNASTDRIFLSVEASGNVGVTGNACTGACVYSFNVTSFTNASPILTTTEATNGLASTGGSSGVIIDNAATTPTGTSQVYFSTLGNEACAGNGTTGIGTGGCAVQASQSGLR